MWHKSSGPSHVDPPALSKPPYGFNSPPFLTSPFVSRETKRQRKTKGKERYRNHHGGSCHRFPIPNGSRRAGIFRPTLGSHCDPIRYQGRELPAANLWIGRSFTASMRELLRLLQHLLRTRPVGLDLRSLWNPQWAHLTCHYALLSSSVLCRDDVLFYRS